MPDVINLDILKPEKKPVQIGGYTIDCSFIPVGSTFEIDEIYTKSMSLDTKKIEEGDKEENRKALELSIALCAAFCEHDYPELDKDFFMNNCNAEQIGAFANILADTLIKSYRGAKESAKNRKAGKGISA